MRHRFAESPPSGRSPSSRSPSGRHFADAAQTAPPAAIQAAPQAAPRTPDISLLRSELERVQRAGQSRGTLKRTLGVLATVAAVVVLATTLFFPVLRISGASMAPSLLDGEIVVTVKTSDFEAGDIVSFKFNNKTLVKRVIATAGQWVDIDAEGNVFVDGVLLDEPYVDEKSFEECDIELPYQVPDGKVFVMGDHRATSVDSRSAAVGCVSQEQIVGKALLRIWPFDRFGPVE